MVGKATFNPQLFEGKRRKPAAPSKQPDTNIGNVEGKVYLQENGRSDKEGDKEEELGQNLFKWREMASLQQSELPNL